MNEDGTASKYGRYHCICTNIIDGAFALTPEVLSSPLPLLLMHTSLHQAISKISNGDYDAVSEGDLLLSVDATVQDVGTVLKILHDTDQVASITPTHNNSADIHPGVARRHLNIAIRGAYNTRVGVRGPWKAHAHAADSSNDTSRATTQKRRVQRRNCHPSFVAGYIC